MLNTYLILCLLIPGLVFLIYEIITLKIIENPGYRKTIARILYFILIIIVVGKIVKEFSKL
jgi:hypothetical protein